MTRKRPDFFPFTALLFLVAGSAGAQDQKATGSQCFETDSILSYRVESDELIRFVAAGGQETLVSLRPACPQLRFHGYVSYTPVNGQLCAGVDEVKTRAGLPCRISKITTKVTEKVPEE